MDPCDQKTQDYHQAIRNVVQHLKFKRCELQNDINHDEVEKARVEGEMNKLQDKLSILKANLKKKSEFRREYDKAITQSEEHFTELLRKSEDFLSMTRREALALSHAVSDGADPSLSASPVCLKEPIPEKCEPPKSLSPSAMLAVQPPEPTVNCANCSGAAPCTTIMIPYRANGL